MVKLNVENFRANQSQVVRELRVEVEHLIICLPPISPFLKYFRQTSYVALKRKGKDDAGTREGKNAAR